MYQNKLMILVALSACFTTEKCVFLLKRNILLHNIKFSPCGFVTKGVALHRCLMLRDGKTKRPNQSHYSMSDAVQMNISICYYKDEPSVK
jgi:hypothetical protein